MGRYTYLHHDWQRNDSLMQCYDCQALVYSKYMNGHTKICGVDIEKDRQEAARSGREEAKGNAKDQPTIKGSDQATAKSTSRKRVENYPATRRSGRCSDGGDSQKISKEQAEKTLSLFNMQ